MEYENNYYWGSFAFTLYNIITHTCYFPAIDSKRKLQYNTKILEQTFSLYKKYYVALKNLSESICAHVLSKILNIYVRNEMKNRLKSKELKATLIKNKYIETY